MAPWVVATSLIASYLLLIIVLGVMANRRLTVDVEDFSLYGRKARFIVLYLTIVATYHSAFAFLGSSGFFYTHGIGFWDAGAWTVLVGGITYVLGSRIWALGKRFGYITPAEMLADFYESESVRVVTAFVSVVFTILYIQVQAQGLGYIISVASNDHISYELGTLVLLVAAAGYLMAGGLRAVYWTDVIQGVWMYLAIWIGALVLVYKLFGGPIELWKQVAIHRPDLLTAPGPEGFFTPGMWFGLLIVLSFGIVFQPHIMLRYYTAISGNTIKWLGATTPIFTYDTFYSGCPCGSIWGPCDARARNSRPRVSRTSLSVFTSMVDRHNPSWCNSSRHVNTRFNSSCEHDGTDTRYLSAIPKT